MFNFFSNKKVEKTVEESTCTALIPYIEHKNEFIFDLPCRIGSQIWTMYKNRPIQAYIDKIEILIKENDTAVFYYWESTEGITNGFFCRRKRFIL